MKILNNSKDVIHVEGVTLHVGANDVELNKKGLHNPVIKHYLEVGTLVVVTEAQVEEKVEAKAEKK